MSSRRIFLTGGGGFVGASVLDALLASDVSVNALVTTKPLDRPAGRVTSFTGGLLDDRALDAAMAGCDAAIHLVGIIAERPSHGITFDRIHVHGTARVIAAAKKAGVRRFLHMSALGARPDAPSAYHKTKFQAEELVGGSDLDWTIFRPSLIHGPRGEFTRQMAGWARHRKIPFLFMPYFARGLLGLGGSALVQPIFVDDIARLFVEALAKPDTIGELYPVAGPDRMTWPAMYRTVAEALTGSPKATLPIPIWKAKMLASAIPPGWLPFEKDQVKMAAEDNICDTTKATAAFGWQARAFADAVGTYARSL
jgi:nucleoside-diphosphate-sugar epimerase